MADNGSFWQRVGNAFNSAASHVTQFGGNGSNEHGKRVNGAVEVAAPAGELATELREQSWWRRWQPRHPGSGDLALRMVQLADAMERHFRQQDTRARELAGSLDRVGSVLEQLADTQRAQGESLKRIADQADAASRHTANMSDTLARIPDSLLTQAEAIRAVAMQLDLAQDTDLRLRESLQQFGQAVGTLGTTGREQTLALRDLNSFQREQHDALTQLVHVQSRRFLLVLGTMGGLAAAALVTLSVALLLGLP